MTVFPGVVEYHRFFRSPAFTDDHFQVSTRPDLSYISDIIKIQPARGNVHPQNDPSFGYNVHETCAQVCG